MQVISEKGGDRSSLLINLGGGVVTDMGGFVASTFKRGIDYVNIPTHYYQWWMHQLEVNRN